MVADRKTTKQDSKSVCILTIVYVVTARRKA